MTSYDPLRALHPIRPAGDGHAGPRPGAAGPADLPFDRVFALLAAGTASSSRGIQVATELDPPLGREQSLRLADAADEADAAGLQRAAVLLDGRAFDLAVPGRTITRELAAHARSTIWTEFDGGVLVPPRTDNQHVAPHLNGLPPAAVSRAIDHGSAPS